MTTTSNTAGAQAEAVRLDAAIEANLKALGFGDDP